MKKKVALLLVALILCVGIGTQAGELAGVEATSEAFFADVRYWHKADITPLSFNVRFWG